jgi:radical SAM superfamily enzyme YgiQ (UPF0313 family)
LGRNPPTRYNDRSLCTEWFIRNPWDCIVPDVIYVHPARHAADAGFQDLGFYFFMPVGVIGLANLLRREGVSVRGINYPAELVRDRSFRLRPWLKAQDGVRLVMIDLHWFEHAYGAISVARTCRELLPGAKVLLGGFTASFYAAEILSSFPEVDFVIRGDAEVPLSALARELGRAAPDLSAVPNLTYRRDGQVVENGLTYCAAAAELDALDFVDLDFLEHADVYRRLQFEPTGLTRDLIDPRGHWLCIGRGCAFDCAFCGGGSRSQALLAGREAVVLRAPAAVAADIERLASMGIHQVSPNLDPAVMGHDYWSALFAELRRRGVRIGINNELFQLPTAEFVADFLRTADIARSELAFTLLSGSDKVRRMNGKFHTNQRLFPILVQLKAAGVPIYVYFSLNLPGEDERTFRETLQLARRIGQTYPPHLLKMINQLHTLDPCCPMSREPGRFSAHITLRRFADYYDYCRTTLDLDPARTSPSHARGFVWRGKQAPPLDVMIRQWNDFCARQDFACFRVPLTW